MVGWWERKMHVCLLPYWYLVRLVKAVQNSAAPISALRTTDRAYVHRRFSCTNETKLLVQVTFVISFVVKCNIH